MTQSDSSKESSSINVISILFIGVATPFNNLLLSPFATCFTPFLITFSLGGKHPSHVTARPQRVRPHASAAAADLRARTSSAPRSLGAYLPGWILFVFRDVAPVVDETGPESSPASSPAPEPRINGADGRRRLRCLASCLTTNAVLGPRPQPNGDPGPPHRKAPAAMEHLQGWRLAWQGCGVRILAKQLDKDPLEPPWLVEVPVLL